MADEGLSVLLTVHHSLEQGTGAAGTTLALAAELQDRGHRVEVLGFDDLARRRGTTVDSIAFPHHVARIVRRRLDRADVDVIDASSGDLAYVSASRVRAASTAVFTRSHGLEHLASERRRSAARAGELDLRWRYSLYHGGIRLREVAHSFAVADGALLLNDAEVRFAERSLGVASDRVWRTSPVLDGAVQRLPRAPSRDVLVLGAASWRKGGDVAIRVLESLLRADSATTVSWHGLEDPAHVAAGLADDLGDRATLGGPYSREALAELLAGHRVLLFASRSEGLPVTLLEALRSGIAIVGSDVPGVSDLLGSGAGVVVPDGHVEGMAGAVRMLLADGPARSACEAYGADVAAAHSPQVVVDALLGAYRTVLVAKRATGSVSAAARAARRP
ncbi:MAG TPA: glycosyltransferase family 4 protein [Acidimicrobiales bacterium]|nr:glycosyltransferase family 4 protein [Acidimicrobiales bacterium]